MCPVAINKALQTGFVCRGDFSRGHVCPAVSSLFYFRSKHSYCIILILLVVSKGYEVWVTTKCSCSNTALCNFHVIDGQNTQIRFPVIEGLHAHDQIAFYAFHSFSVGVQTKLAT